MRKFADQIVTDDEVIKVHGYTNFGSATPREILDETVTNDIAPCQAQAILWLTRKRILGVKYTAQLSFFREAKDAHRTLCKPEDFPPYPLKQEKKQ